jgi:AraC-like DNA-binding protein
MISKDLLARMCRARSVLQEQLEPPAAVSSVACEAGMSPRHFITQFRALFGETPAQCRNRARLAVARERLMAGGEPITQIALALGYENAGSFSRLFQQRFGCSPRAYRVRAAAGGLQSAGAMGCVPLMTAALSGGGVSAKSAGAV